MAVRNEMRAALELARHDLATLHGLVAADAAAPQETWRIDTLAVIAAIDAALSAAVDKERPPSEGRP